MQTNKEAMRAVLADASEGSGQLGKIGEMLTAYTATRAWRGGYLGRTGEVVLLSAPALVWRGDKADATGPSKYFVRGPKAKPIAAQEEPSGARLVVVPLSGIVHACAHGVAAPEAGDLPQLGPHGYPLPGALVHLCSVTHEARGRVESLIAGEFVVLADDAEQAMVNDIADNDFAAVLAGKSQGSDHFATAGLRFALSALTAIVVR